MNDIIPDKVIGRGTWIDKLAAQIVAREKDLGRSLNHLHVESGLGASGVPHLGSLGDAVRSYGVKLALEDMGYDSSLIAYSDDLDGLRKVPEGFPDSLSEDLARPVSLISDPYGCCDSYGAHMSNILLEGLDMLGIEYTFERAYDMYRTGQLARQTHTILSQADTIGEKIHAMVGQDKYVHTLPYFAVCGSCHKLYTTPTYRYDPQSRRVSYRCGDITMGSHIIRGCGHDSFANIERDLGKLAWKVEFAARWDALDVRFEAYGKDIMDSVAVNDWVIEHILKTPSPSHIRYEMFLDRGGRKMSKSRGNVVTTQDWLRVGSPQSLLMLLYKRIRGARHLGIEDVPSLMNEYNELEDLYFGRAKIDNMARRARLRGLYEYANLLHPPKQSGVHLNYTMLVELARVFSQDRVRHISDKLREYNLPSGDDTHKIIQMACRFADEHVTIQRPSVVTDDTTKDALRALVGKLKDGKEPQMAIYKTAKEAGLKPRDFFGVLYRIMLGSPSGPRLGPFISDMGVIKASEMILEYVNGEDGT